MASSNDLPTPALHLHGQSEEHDTAYATDGSRSRLQSEAIQTGRQNTPIPPPQYGAPPLPPPAAAPPPHSATQQQHGGYNQMQDSYPTYTNGNAVFHAVNGNGKPILPADEMGKGWLGFNMQDIRDLSPKAKKRLIWWVLFRLALTYYLHMKDSDILSYFLSGSEY